MAANSTPIRFGLVLTLALVAVPPAQAGWLDDLLRKLGGTPVSGSAAVTEPTQDEIVRGLKEALSKGVEEAIAELGRDGGYLGNLQVKIPMPENLAKVERTLRTFGQDKLADDFIATLNRAAEQAVPEAGHIFAEAIGQMSLEDARGILAGPDDAATQFFRRKSEARLQERFLPIVRTTTEKAGVTAAYKRLMQQAGPLAQLLGARPDDLDTYVTAKAMDGLFKMVAAEEQNIRQNPVARTTDLLRKVFGSVGK